MDDLAGWLKNEGLSDCYPYVSQYSLSQLVALPSLPQNLLDEKPKLAKKLKSALKSHKKAMKKPTSSGKDKFVPPVGVTMKPIIVPSTSNDTAQYKNIVSPPQETIEPLPHLPYDQDPTPQDLDNLIRLCRESNKRIADAWKIALESGPRTVDDEEFIITTDLVSSTLGCLASTPISNTSDFRLFYSKLRQFCEIQQEYASIVCRPEQLRAVQTSRSRRRKVGRLNSRMHMEIKWVLEASGITNSQRESLAIRKRSLGRITVKEGQALWEAHFHDLDMDMVPWDRFIGAFMMHTKTSIDMHDEILLRHILDNDNLGTVTPKQFSSFLKCFGPLDKSLENVKHLYKQKWFHDFLSVEEVHRLLADQPAGTFLVRFSRSHSNSFALEYVSGKVLTVLVRNDMPNGVYIKEENNVEKMFPNIDSLIKHYADILKIPFQSDLVIQPWFVGDVSTADAEEMLMNRPPGTFMIRFAASGRFQYACSYVSSNGIKHTMIQKVPNGYVIEETRSSVNPNNTNITSQASNPTRSGTSPASPEGSAPISVSPSNLPSSTTNTTTTAPTSSPTVYPSLQAFLKVWKSELKYNYDVENVPNMPVAEFMEADRYVNLNGPGDVDGNGGSAEFGGKVFAQTVASYPKSCLGWQVVCDQWYVRLLGNRIVFALADGCNWGPAPREAARRACQAIIDQVGDRDVQARIRDTMEGRHYLLRSFSVAHEQVLAGTATGTTTLLAGILLEVDPDNDEWALVAASVGDCKAFVYMSDVDKCIDVTLGNRRNLRDARDPGGRLGAYDRDDLPDLRNLSSYFWPMKKNDVLMVVSDGVHDNLDPESFGKNPPDLAKDFSDSRLVGLANSKTDWDDMDQDSTEKLKSTWMLSKLHQIITKQAKDRTAKSISNSLIEHSMITTKPSRDFMEANPDKPEPADHVQYPGKMDHTTAITITVGPFFKDLVSWRNKSSRGLTASPAPSMPSSSNFTSASPQPSLSSSGSITGAAVATGFNSIKNKAIVQEDLKSEARQLNTKQYGSSAPSKANSNPNAFHNVPPVSGRPVSPASAPVLTSISSGQIAPRQPLNLTPLQLLPTLFRVEPSYLSAPPSSPYQSESSIIVSHASGMFQKFPAITLSPLLQNSADSYSFQIANVYSNDSDISCGNLATGRSISTYPVDTSAISATSATKKRMGDPNTAHFCLDINPTRMSFAISAGTTWGASAADASYKACHSFFHSIRESQADVETAKDAAISCLKAFDECQSAITQVSEDVQSSVVLLAGILAQTPQDKRWMSIFVTLGNNKAFVWKHATKTVIDLTDSNEGSDRRQIGGWLCTDPRNHAPELSNLCVSFSDLESDDIILLMTSGAYLNFDPELLGLSPNSDVIEPQLKADTWQNENPEHKQAKATFRCKAIEQVLASSMQDEPNASDSSLPKKFSNAIVDYCKKTTSLAREFMETNPTASEPAQRSKYPGKMGHVLCLAIRANRFTSQEASAASQAAARRELLTTQNRPMKA